MAAAADGYDYWDFDRRPQSIPQGIVFKPIYYKAGNAGVLDYHDWNTSAVPAQAAQMDNSLWFSSNDGTLNGTSDASRTTPVDGNSAATPSSASGDPIAFQLDLATCDPTATSSSCVAYMIAVSDGGDVRLIKCDPSAHGAGANSNSCF